MTLTTNKNDPDLNKTRPSGQQEKYLILSEEERAKGFVRPVRHSYKHMGIKPRYELRDLTPEQHEQYDKYNYVKYEEYPENLKYSVTGRYWTEKDLKTRCEQTTKMGQALCETYARNPKFYGSTYT